MIADPCDAPYRTVAYTYDVDVHSYSVCTPSTMTHESKSNECLTTAPSEPVRSIWVVEVGERNSLRILVDLGSLIIRDIDMRVADPFPDSLGNSVLVTGGQPLVRNL